MTETMLAATACSMGMWRKIVRTGTMTMPPPRPLMEPMIPPAKEAAATFESQRMDWVVGVIGERDPNDETNIVCWICSWRICHLDFADQRRDMVYNARMSQSPPELMACMEVWGGS